VKQGSWPIIVGEIIILDEVDIEFNSTAGVLIDPWAIEPPVITATGQTLGASVEVNVEDFSLMDGTVQVSVTNYRTGDHEIINATFAGEDGEFYGSFMTNCDGTDLTSTIGDGIINALPFDIIDLMYYNNATNQTATTSVTLAFVYQYQETLGWPIVSTTLMKYTAQKTYRKLTNLKQKIVYILHHLPPYEQNDCCSNGEYSYPLNVAAFAERSYQFYAGNIYGPVGCQSLINYQAHVLQDYNNIWEYDNTTVPIEPIQPNNERRNMTVGEGESKMIQSLEEKITIKTILQALFGDKFSA